MHCRPFVRSSDTQWAALSRRLRQHRYVCGSLFWSPRNRVHGMRGDGARMAIRHPWTFLCAGARRSVRSLYSSPRVTRSLLFHPEAPDSLVNRFMDECQEESWLAASQMNTLLPDPTKVLCRVHVIAASHDNMVSARSSLQTASTYRTKLQEIRRSGHMIPLEAADELARALCDDWTCPTFTDGYRLDSQAGLVCSIGSGAGLSTGGVAAATQSPTVGNPCWV